MLKPNLRENEAVSKSWGCLGKYGILKDPVSLNLGKDIFSSSILHFSLKLPDFQGFVFLEVLDISGP